MQGIPVPPFRDASHSGRETRIMAIKTVRTDHYRIPLPVVLSDSTHGEIPAFEIVSVRITDEDGLEGVGYTYSVGRGGAAIHALIERDMAPDLIGEHAARV